MKKNRRRCGLKCLLWLLLLGIGVGLLYLLPHWLLSVLLLGALLFFLCNCSGGNRV